VLFSHQQFLHM